MNSKEFESNPIEEKINKPLDGKTETNPGGSSEEIRAKQQDNLKRISIASDIQSAQDQEEAENSLTKALNTIPSDGSGNSNPGGGSFDSGPGNNLAGGNTIPLDGSGNSNPGGGGFDSGPGHNSGPSPYSSGD